MKKYLSRKILCSILAAGLCGTASLALAANSGGAESTIKPNNDKYYVGNNGTGSNNDVYFDDNDPKYDGVYGGYVEGEGEANNNRVVINSSTINIVGGGVLERGNVNNNNVCISGSTIVNVAGGAVLEGGNVNNNNVRISGSTIDRVFGGELEGEGKGKINNNSVYINDSVIRTAVYGGALGIGIIGSGYSKGEVNNNSVFISDITINNSGNKFTGNIYGGYLKGEGETNNNCVSISNVNSSESFGGSDGIVVGGYVEGEGEANNNCVSISNVYGSADDLINSNIYGGFVKGEGKANNNCIVINNVNGSKLESGLYGMVVGGCAGEGEANNNLVVIHNSTITKDVYGGGVGSGETNNNIVYLGNNSLVVNVYGGYVVGEGEANNNTIILSDNLTLGYADLYGRNDEADGTGNKLVLIDFKGTDGTDNGRQVKTLNNFDSIEVKALGDDKEYTTGQKLTLLTATGNEDSGRYIYNCKVGERTQYALLGTDRVAVEVKGNVAIEGDNNEKVTFTVEGMQASRQSAITTEARAGVTAFVNQGAEVVADNLNMLSQSAEGINTFATVSGNNSKYDTGSYADINGWNSIVGIASTKEIGSDKLNYGAFFENGSGNYNTCNEIGGASFRGDGNVLYNGGGVMVRLDKENGFYTEAAIKAGKVKNELNRGLADAKSNNYGYETENAYYGGHIGIGKIFKLDNGKAWDVYGKYFHMHHEGDSVEIAGDTFDFDSVDSNKLRIGARFSEQQGEKLTSYYGLAWDYEFNGDVSGTAAGYDMHTPSLEGSTVIGEVGFRYIPGKESSWYFDANVKGYVGLQEGLSGSVQAVYSF